MLQRLIPAIEQIGPRVYTIQNVKDPNNVNFFVLGCQGSRSDAQKNVAYCMDNSPIKPDFVVVVGDNVYNNGANTPDDVMFNECFHDIYEKHSSNALNGVPFFLILGNHDENYQRKTRGNLGLLANKGRQVGLNQVMHTYLESTRVNYSNELMQATIGSNSPSALNDGNVSEHDKINLFAQDRLDLNKLGRWNMPYFFYSIIIHKLQIFCLNSNSIAADFLEYHRNYSSKQSDVPPQNNQIVWLIAEYKKAVAAGRTIIFAQHHPLFTSGKRALPSKFDTLDYLSENDISLLHGILNTTTNSYNALLRLIYNFLDFKPKTLIVAHDHCLQYYCESESTNLLAPISQITSGGGGGDLQRRVVFDGHQNIGCYLREHGFSALSCDAMNPEEIEINFYTVNDHHLRFNTSNHEPICTSSDNETLNQISKIILKSVDEYWELLTVAKTIERKDPEYRPSPVSHLFQKITTVLASSISGVDNYMHEDIDGIHGITAYLNQYQLGTYEAVVKELYTLFSNLSGSDVSNKDPFFRIKEIMIPYFQIKSQTERTRFISEKAGKLIKMFDAQTEIGIEPKIKNMLEFVIQLPKGVHPFHALVNQNLKRLHNGQTIEKLYHSLLQHQPRWSK